MNFPLFPLVFSYVQVKLLTLSSALIVTLILFRAHQWFSSSCISKQSALPLSSHRILCFSHTRPFTPPPQAHVSMALPLYEMSFPPVLLGNTYSHKLQASFPESFCKVVSSINLCTYLQYNSPFALQCISQSMQ